MPLPVHAGLCSRAIGMAGLILLASHPSTASSLTRALPDSYAGGMGFPVEIAALPDASTGAYAVEDRVPTGWTVSGLSHGGVWDAVTGSVKWGPFVDTPALSRVLTYQVHPPAGSEGVAMWSGEGRFNGARTPIQGDRQVSRFPGELTRRWPSSYSPGVSLEVILTANPAADVEVYAVEERIPEGWEVGNISHGGQFDRQNRRIKWGPFLEAPAQARELRVEVTPPPDALGRLEFEARAWFDSAEVVRADLLPRRLSQAVLQAPDVYQPGMAVDLELRLEPVPWVGVQAAELELPAGWMVDSLTEGGVVDRVNGKLKWGPYADAVPQPRQLRARLIPPATADGTIEIAGSIRFDRETVIVRNELSRYREVSESRVIRVLPPEFEPGVAVLVELDVRPRDGTPVFSVEDILPAGWTLDQVDSGGTFDALNRKVKWGPVFAPNATPGILRYRAVAGPGAAAEARFVGVGWFGGDPRAVEGDAVSVAPVGRVERTLPARYTPGGEFILRVEAAPGPGTDTYAVEESLPAGWTFLDAVEGGVFDPVQRRVKWGPFPDRNRRTLTYRARPPADATGPAPFAGVAVFNRTRMEVSGAAESLLNQKPVAVPNPVERIPGRMVKISAIQLVANDGDPDGDFLRVTGVSPVSLRGASLVLAWPWIFYSPPPGYDGPDTFDYIVRDEFGGEVSAEVEVVVVPPSALAQNILSAQTLADGTRLIRFGGIPGYTYQVEASTDLYDWIRLAARTASGLGQFEYLDIEAPSFPIRYYRSTWP